ncbi:MAG: LarC family nickel insertion protein [Promethearchaeota archaeon]
MKKILYVDCSSTGFSGDICLAGLADLAGQLDPRPFKGEELLGVLELVPKVVPDIGEFHPSFEVGESGGVRVTRFELTMREERTERTIHDLQSYLGDLLSLGHFSGEAARFARGVLDKLVGAEMFVHGGHHHRELHLHELSSADTFCDILGPAFALDAMGVFDGDEWEVYIGPVALGGGTVKIHHGTVPVPAPATSYVLQHSGLLTRGGPVDLELLTPTGSAILATLLEEGNAHVATHQPLMVVRAVGVGAGQKVVPGRANAARFFVGDASDGAGVGSEWTVGGVSAGIGASAWPAVGEGAARWGKVELVKVLETNLDDVTGEDLGELVHLLYEQGALDVHLVPTTTKKNRPGVLVRVVAEVDGSADLTGTIIRNTGTLGVRFRAEKRECLAREVVRVNLKLGGKEYEVGVKVAKDNSGAIVNFKPEHDDVKRVSRETGAPPREVRFLALEKAREKLGI